LSITLHIVSNIPPSIHTNVSFIYHQHKSAEIFKNKKVSVAIYLNLPVGNDNTISMLR